MSPGRLRGAADCAFFKIAHASTSNNPKRPSSLKIWSLKSEILGLSQNQKPRSSSRLEGFHKFRADDFFLLNSVIMT